MYNSNSTNNSFLINNYHLFYSIIIIFSVIIFFQFLLFFYFLYIKIKNCRKRKFFSVKMGVLNHSLNEEEMNKLNELTSI
jgi:hypothetical protein